MPTVYHRSTLMNTALEAWLATEPSRPFGVATIAWLLLRGERAQPSRRGLRLKLTFMVVDPFDGLKSPAVPVGIETEKYEPRSSHSSQAKDTPVARVGKHGEPSTPRKRTQAYGERG